MNDEYLKNMAHQINVLYESLLDEGMSRSDAMEVAKNYILALVVSIASMSN